MIELNARFTCKRSSYQPDPKSDDWNVYKEGEIEPICKCEDGPKFAMLIMTALNWFDATVLKDDK
jgi:hypothetical protein